MKSVHFSICFFLFVGSAFAQTDRGTITGTISDPVAAVIANATVEARNVNTGAVYQAGSSDTGNFTLAQIPAGTYELSVTSPGFKRFVRPGIIVPVAQVVRVDATLEVGAPSEVVTVQADAPLLRTESGELSHNIDYDRINNLPLITLGGGGIGNIRNPLQVVTLLPGAHFATDSVLRINGLPSNTGAIRIEGQDATNGMWRQQTQINQASMEAMQEVSIQTSNFAAEYGQAAGGYFNYTMRSGSNEYHGSAYNYMVNEALHAGTPFTDDGTGKHLRNRQRRNNYGFSGGGPVRIPNVYDGRDKTFFFFNFEQFRETQFTTTGITTVPTLAYRQGDFSAALAPNLTIAGVAARDPLGRLVPQNGVYDPLTTRFAPDGSVVRDLFPNNVIPISRMDPVMRKIQDLIPLPTNSQLINNYAIPGYSNSRLTNITSIKIDHSLSPTIKLSGYLGKTHTKTDNANGIAAPLTSATPTDNPSYTTRLNYDHTLRPTLLLHVGVGLMLTTINQLPAAFKQSELGLTGFYEDLFPAIAGLSGAAQRGGASIGIGVGRWSTYVLKDIKPTMNASLTWVKGNHTYKMGAEAVVEGFPQFNRALTNGSFGFSAVETSLPWENGRGLNATTGFPYASFFLGRASSLQVSPPSFTRLGNHSFGLFIQDTWKVTRKLTLDYGLRYDYVTYLREQYGRMQSAAFDLPNPTIGGRLGAVQYEGYGPGRCNCDFSKNYPYAFGPRLGVAYQLTPRTVLRAGAGISYGTASNNSNLSLSVADFYTAGPAGYGEAATILAQGNPYASGNPFGNPPLVWPDFDPGKYPFKTATGYPPQSPFIYIDKDSRPPRIAQWSIGLQREVARNLVVEASYVGNRGVWFTAPILADKNYNALQPSDLTQYGLDFTKAADRSLLVTPINSPAVIARFPKLADPNSVYPGFPATQPLYQALRPFPQWGGIPVFLGPPLGSTWYDSLQAKVTKRYSHGLDLQAAFTWGKELTLGANADTSYLGVVNTPLINDVFDRRSNKQVSAFNRPFMLVVSFNYTTPGFNRDGYTFKALSWAVRDWTIGGVLRYQSGSVIRVPASNNSVTTQLARGSSALNNLPNWGGGTTFWNRNPGVPLLLVDPNCKCFDPTQALALNPAAWTDAPAGTFGTSAPYYNDFRWQRQPSEALSLGRNFRMGPEGRYNLQIRVEFQNSFNRLFLSMPSATNPAATITRNTAGVLTGGYGYINTVNGAGSSPRRGTLVARFTF